LVSDTPAAFADMTNATRMTRSYHAVLKRVPMPATNGT
jgi:hypothetical protein